MRDAKLASEEYFFLSDTAKYQLGKVEDILSLEVSQNYTKVTLADSRTFLIRGPLYKYETRLPAESFFRANRECVVNLRHIKEMKMHDSKRFGLQLSDSRYIIMSRYQSILFRRLKSF